MYRKILIFVNKILICIYFLSSQLICIDLTLIGQMKFSDSLSGLAPNIIDTLKDEISINFIRTNQHIDLKDMPQEIKRAFFRSYFKNEHEHIGNVIIYTDIIWYKLFNNTFSCLDFLPKKRNITIAYSMLESDAIPTQWVKILNVYFDAVLVPDEFLISIYENAGVKIPVFVVPYPIYLKDFFERESKKNRSSIFTFGMSGLGLPHKNFELLLQAFDEEFKNDKNVLLKLHTRRADKNFIKKIQNYIDEKQIINIQLIDKYFSRTEYIDFLCSLDCYVLISKGEGFSVTPREALALGIPCILSNNSGHSRICKTNLVRSVQAEIKEPAYYNHLGFVGNYYNCNVSDVREALTDVYNNYETWFKKAKEGREWVKQYSTDNIKAYYLNLVKPVKVILSEKNEITADCLSTRSKFFCEKYK